MPKIRSPRHGSMQYWPRKKAARPHARIRTFTEIGEAKPLAFAGYKAGMTHVIITENKKTSLLKGQEVAIPVTIVECPPIKVAAIRFYKDNHGKKVAYSEVLSSKIEKELGRKLTLPKKVETDKKIDALEKELNIITDIRLIVYTQPKLTGIGKKKPELFEVALGGEVKAKLEYAKKVLGHEISVGDVFKEGLQVDIHAITKGKGFCGPVKRFGIAIRQHKAEKTKRGPGAVGPWHPHHGNYTVAHAGQMGFFTRMEKNKQIIKISNNAKEVNQKGGFLHYGVVKNQYIMLKGSIPGTAKRLIKFTFSQRKNKHMTEEAPAVQHVANVAASN